jgi:hypothetical protein
MEFSREDVLQVVINALQDAQQEVQEDTIEIYEKTRPIDELKAFDSLTSVYVTVHCLHSLGYPDPLALEFPSLFIDKNGKVLTVGEVVDRILKLLKNK